MTTIKLAFRNIIGAGIRTWLNVFVLSIAFVSLIWLQGLMKGTFEQVKTDTINSELGGGQYWHRAYDPFDPLSLEDAHGRIPSQLRRLVSQGDALPILATLGAIFPEGREQMLFIKGIQPEQQILELPMQALQHGSQDIIPAVIGTRMAKQARLKAGDIVTMRWRDIHGTFDALDIQIGHILRTNNPAVDMGQVWVPLPALQNLMQAPGEATLVVLRKGVDPFSSGDAEWIFKSTSMLLKEMEDMAQMKQVGNSVFSLLVLAMALLAIFDTQVLAIFRRRKEMGTLMALGMNRSRLVGLFTLEGAFHGVLALVVGAVYGIPLLALTATKGIPLPLDMGDQVGVAFASKLYPIYGLPLVIGSVLLVIVSVTLVSYLPTREIAKLKPTDALRGKLS